MFPILGRLHRRKRRSSGMGRRAGTPCYSETTKDQWCFYEWNNLLFNSFKLYSKFMTNLLTRLVKGFTVNAKVNCLSPLYHFTSGPTAIRAFWSKGAARASK